jgi:misacylated tRNA(Ala) deacylase
VTDAVFQRDSYLQQLDAVVTALDAEFVELDKTIFYAEGGGQPGDTGRLTGGGGRSVRVIDTRKGVEPGSIWHQVSGEDHGLTVGDKVELAIDWERRYRLMRMHTSMHLLGSLIPVPVTGGKVGADKSRLDFNLGDQQLDKEWLTEQMNVLIRAGHDVGLEAITEAELDANPGLVRTMSVQPPRGVGDIRMVRVQGIDFQPCGGTHVKNTSEIGPVKISKIENKGRQNRRVHLLLDS